MKAAFGTELSQEQELREVEMAFTNQFPSHDAMNWYPWVTATFDDLVIIEVSGKYYKVAYTEDGGNLVFALFEDWEEVEKQEEWVTKSMNRMIKLSRIKAVGDWELEVLGVPFGSFFNKDKQGEYFDASTKLHLERYPNPAVHYYHGFDPDGYPQGDPEEIGEVQSTEVREDGVWYRVLLDKTKDLAKRVMDAAKEGLARASSGSVEHLFRRSRDGHIENWPVIELSLFDMDESVGRAPANNYAVALPVAKSLFERAGIKYPDDLPRSKAKAKGDKQRAEAASRIQLKAREYLLGDEDES
jgi:hypothetical protein